MEFCLFCTNTVIKFLIVYTSLVYMKLKNIGNKQIKIFFDEMNRKRLITILLFKLINI